MEQLINTPSQKLQWIDYKGIRIFYADLKKLKVEEYYDILLEIRDFYSKQQPNSLVTILDITDSFISPESQKLQKEITKMGISKHAAVIGITGLKKILAQAVRPDLYWAKDMEDAKNWIVRECQSS